MKKVFGWLKIAVPFIEMGASQLEGMDDNDTGKDDEAGRFLEYVVSGLKAIIAGQPVPKAPPSLQD